MNDPIYTRALADFNEAVESYRTVCDKIKEGKENDFAANNSLNTLISLSWRLKDAALLKEPAPLPPRRPIPVKKRKEDEQA